jgi:hypothetical protein
MRKLILAVCPFLLLATNAAGAVCANTSLDNYLGSSFSCNVGDLLFSNFDYDAISSVGLPPVTAADIQVEPVEGGFRFQGGFDAGPNQQREMLLSYLVTSTTGLTGSALSILGFGAFGTGLVTVGETQCLNGTFQADGSCNGTMADLFVFKSEGSDSTLDTVSYSVPVTSVHVLKDIIVSGGEDGTAAFSLLFNTFPDGGGPGAIPEPASVSLLGSGLVVTALLLRRYRNVRTRH